MRARIHRVFFNLLEGFWREAQAPRQNLFANVTESVVKAQTLVRCFYAAMLYVAFTQLQRWEYFESLRALNPIWLVRWVDLLPWEVSLRLILFLFVIGAFAAVIFAEHTWARFLAFLGCIEFYGLYYSFHAISHRDHLFVLAAFMLIFLSRKPDRDASAEAKQDYLLSFFGVQALILLTYTMAGLVKIAISINSALEGNGTIFEPQHLAGVVLAVQADTAHETLLGPYLMMFPWLGFLLFLTVIFAEVFAFYVAFRPSLHRPYGFFMAGMHIGIATTLGLFFATHLLTVALFLIASPFVPTTFRFWATVHDLPMIGPFISALRLKRGRKRLAGSNTISVFYDQNCSFSCTFVRFMLKQSLPPNILFGGRQNAPFQALKARYSYFETPESLVALVQIGDEERVFVRSEAALLVLSTAKGPQSYAFLLFLLIPPPLLDWGYRLLMLTSPRRTTSQPPTGQRERFLDPS